MSNRKKIYTWRTSKKSYGVEAAIAGPLLDKLERKNGKLTPDLVVAEARKGSSPLHSAFEWDDSKAAHQFRRVQARQMIRDIYIVAVTYTGGDEVEVATTAVPSFPHVPTPGDPSYRRLDAIMADDELYELMLEEARTALRAFKRRYGMLKELQPLVEAMDKWLMGK